MKVLAVTSNNASCTRRGDQFDSLKMKLPHQNAAGLKPTQVIKSAAAVITNNGNHWAGDQQPAEEIPRRDPAFIANGFSPSSSAAVLSTTMKNIVNNDVVGLVAGHDSASACLSVDAAAAMPLTNGIPGNIYRSSFDDLNPDNASLSQPDAVAMGTVPPQSLHASMPLNTTANVSAADEFAHSVMAMPAVSFASAAREFESSINTLEACMVGLNTMSSDVAFVVGERTAAAATKIHDTLHRKLREIYRQQTSTISERARSRSGPQQSRSNAEVRTSDAGSLDHKSIDDSVLPKLESVARNVPHESEPDSAAAVSTSSKPHSARFDWNLVEELRFRSSIAERGVRTIQHAIDEYATDSSSAGSSDDEEVEHGRAVSFDDNKWCGVPIKKRGLYRYAGERACLMKQMKYCDLQTNHLQNWFRQLIILRHMHKQGESSPIDPFHLMLRGDHCHPPKPNNTHLVAGSNNTAAFPQMGVDSSLQGSGHAPAVESATSTRSASPRRGSVQTVESVIRSTRATSKPRDMWWSDFKQNDDKMLVELQAELTAIDRRDNNIPENNTLPLRSFLSPLVASSNDTATNIDTDDDDDDDKAVLPAGLPPAGFAELSSRLLAKRSNKTAEPPKKLPLMPTHGVDADRTEPAALSAVDPPASAAVQPAVVMDLPPAEKSKEISVLPSNDKTSDGKHTRPHSSRLKPIRWRPDLIDLRRRQQSAFINSACNVVTVSTGNGGKHAGVTSETQEPVSWVALARASGLQLDAVAREAHAYIDRHPQFRHLSKVMFNDDQLRQSLLSGPALRTDAAKNISDGAADAVHAKSSLAVVAADVHGSGLTTPSATSAVSELTPPPKSSSRDATVVTADDADDSMFELPVRCRPVQQYLQTQQRPKLFLLNERISVAVQGDNKQPAGALTDLTVPQTVVPAFVRPYRLPSSYRYKDLNKAPPAFDDDNHHCFPTLSNKRQNTASKNNTNMLVNALNRHRSASQQPLPPRQHVSFAVDTYPYAVEENCWGLLYRPCRGSTNFRFDSDNAVWNLVPVSERDAFLPLNSSATLGIGSPFDDDTLDHPALYDDGRQSWLATALQQLNPLAVRSKPAAETAASKTMPANDSYEDQALLPHRAFFGAGLGEQRRDAVRREHLVDRARFLVYQTVEKAHRDRIKYQNLMHADGARRGKDLSRLRAHLRYILRQEQQQLGTDENTGELVVRSAAEQFVVDAQRKLMIQKRRQLLYKQRKLQVLQQQQQQQQPQQLSSGKKTSKKRRRANTSSEDEKLDDEEEDDDEDDYEDANSSGDKRRRKRRHRSASKHSRSMHSRTQSGSGFDNELNSSDESDTDDDRKLAACGSDEEDTSVEASNENLFLLGTIPHHPSHLPSGARARAAAAAAGYRPRASAGKKHVLEHQHHGKSSTMAKGGRKKSFGTPGGGASGGGGSTGSRSALAGAGAGTTDEAASTTFGDTYVVPFGHFGPPRVERLDYKEIKTPQWRRVDIDVLLTSNNTKETDDGTASSSASSAVAVHVTQEICDVSVQQPEIVDSAVAAPFAAKDAGDSLDADDLDGPVDVFPPAPRPQTLCHTLEEVLSDLTCNQDNNNSTSTTSGNTSSQDELLRAFESVLLAVDKSAYASPNAAVESAAFLPPYNPVSSSGKHPSSIVVVIKKKQQVLDRMLMPPPPTPPRSIVLTASSTCTNAPGVTPLDSSASQPQDDEFSATSVTPPDMNLFGDNSVGGSFALNSPLPSSLNSGAVDNAADAVAEAEILLDSAFEGRHASCEQEERQKIMEYLKNLETRKRTRQASDATQKTQAANVVVSQQAAAVDVPNSDDTTTVLNTAEDSSSDVANGEVVNQQEPQPHGDIYEQQIYENFVYDIGYELRRFPLTQNTADISSPASGDSSDVDGGRSMRYTIRRRVSIPKQSQAQHGSDAANTSTTSRTHHNRSLSQPSTNTPQLTNELHANHTQRQLPAASGRGKNMPQRSVGGNFALLKAHGRGHPADRGSFEYGADITSSLSPHQVELAEEGTFQQQQQFDVDENQRFDADFQESASQAQLPIAWSAPFNNSQESVNSHLLARLTGAVKGPKPRRSRTKQLHQQPRSSQADHRRRSTQDDVFDEPTTPPGSPPPELIAQLSGSARASEESSSADSGSSGTADEAATQHNAAGDDVVFVDENGSSGFVVKNEQELLVVDGDFAPSESITTATIPEDHVRPPDLFLPAAAAGQNVVQPLQQQSHDNSTTSVHVDDEPQSVLKKSPFVRSRSLRRSSQASLDRADMQPTPTFVKAEDILQAACDHSQPLLSSWHSDTSDGIGQESSTATSARRPTRRQTSATVGGTQQHKK